MTTPAYPDPIGINTETGQWGSDDGSSAWHRAPHLKGELRLALEDRQNAAHDQGNIATIEPAAILLPKDPSDVGAMVTFCHQWGIQIAPRGAGHTSFGQSLVSGVLIDMRPLNRILAADERFVEAEGGAPLGDIVAAGLVHDVRVRTGVPSILRLTIGGVLSVGGISTLRDQGGLVDAVEELDVVTGTGKTLTCSLHENVELFHAVLGGLGQFGIITRVRLAMVPVPPLVRSYTFRYEHQDLRDALNDQRILSDHPGIDETLIRWAQQESGPPIAELGVGIYYHPQTPPNEQELFQALSRAPIRTADMTYWERAESVDKRYIGYEAQGWSRTTKVWADNFLPDRSSTAPITDSSKVFEELVRKVLEELTERDWSSTSPVLLFRKHRGTFQRRSFRLPDAALGEHVCLFDISSDSFGKTIDESYVPELMARNRRWYEQARQAGGTLYPIGATQFDASDWEHHYGSEYFAELKRLKAKYDPGNVLTPGPGIFS
ncbi:MAG: FAD-binding protein [Corynebacteriales bacterium]|nr:FAD-binding protein [Mycobacteriales bacterium]